MRRTHKEIIHYKLYLECLPVFESEYSDIECLDDMTCYGRLYFLMTTTSIYIPSHMSSHNVTKIDQVCVPSLETAGSDTEAKS